MLTVTSLALIPAAARVAQDLTMRFQLPQFVVLIMFLFSTIMRFRHLELACVQHRFTQMFVVEQAPFLITAIGCMSEARNDRER